MQVTNRKRDEMQFVYLLQRNLIAVLQQSQKKKEFAQVSKQTSLLFPQEVKLCPVISPLINDQY